MKYSTRNTIHSTFGVLQSSLNHKVVFCLPTLLFKKTFANKNVLDVVAKPMFTFSKLVFLRVDNFMFAWIAIVVVTTRSVSTGRGVKSRKKSRNQKKIPERSIPEIKKNPATRVLTSRKNTVHSLRNFIFCINRCVRQVPLGFFSKA